MGNNLRPLDMGTGRTVLQVGLGFNHICALLDDHSVKCWGDDEVGLGYGDPFTRGTASDMGDNLPGVDFGMGVTVRTLAVGRNSRAVVSMDGRVKMWGSTMGLGYPEGRGNGPGQMGDNLPFLRLVGP